MAPAEKKSQAESRQPLVFILGVSFAVFLILFFWRFEIDRRHSEEQAAASALIEWRQARLEDRISKIETKNLTDKAALEDKIRELAGNQGSSSETKPRNGGSPFPLEDVMWSIVELVCIDNTDKDTYYTASGTVVDAGGTIVTNQHILRSDDGSLIRFCGVGFTADLHRPPVIEFVAASRAVHNLTDLAILQIIDRLDGGTMPKSFPSVPMTLAGQASRALNLGDTIYIGGYPGIGADTFTFTEGVVSGRVGSDLIKTSALIDSGTSGGAAFDSGGQYIGVPTAAVRGDIGGSMGYLISAEVVDRFLLDYYANLNLLPENEAD